MSILIARHFKIGLLFLSLAIFFGFVYSLNLLGYFLFTQGPFSADNIRSLHVSLMLYGFIPLQLSLIPFVLFAKSGIGSKKGLVYLERFFLIWYIFLIFMIVTLLFGIRRNLPFYDFNYYLNYILAFAGIFYIKALNEYVKEFTIVPSWTKVFRVIIYLLPFALLILMSPNIGQVNKTIYGPHGDNTLGMSLGVLAIYFLVIKYRSCIQVKVGLNILWIVPLFGYVVSIAHRVFVGELTYNQEWFFQYLTLFFVPLLVYWSAVFRLTWKNDYILLISIFAFCFVDIEGNILFIPELKALFHRNDLVIAHAHLAVAIAIFFLSIAVVQRFINTTKLKVIIYSWSVLIICMSIFLSVNGIVQARLLNFSSETLWILRSICGFFAILIIGYFIFTLYFSKTIRLDGIAWYHLIGFLSDSMGGFLLILFGENIFNLLGFKFNGSYEYIVFGFMISVGAIHFLGFVRKTFEATAAFITAWTRIIISVLFISLFLSNRIDSIGLFVGVYDLVYAAIWIVIMSTNIDISSFAKNKKSIR